MLRVKHADWGPVLGPECGGGGGGGGGGGKRGEEEKEEEEEEEGEEEEEPAVGDELYWLSKNSHSTAVPSTALTDEHCTHAAANKLKLDKEKAFKICKVPTMSEVALFLNMFYRTITIFWIQAKVSLQSRLIGAICAGSRLCAAIRARTCRNGSVMASGSQ